MPLYGVDFSGATKAGNHVWVTTGFVHEGKLRITNAVRGRDLPGSGISREQCLPALREFIKSNHGIYGLDFPFAVHPSQMLACRSWAEFAVEFVSRFHSPQEFRDYCRSVSSKPELKRQCDIISEAPFAPYNLWIYRQTFYGITEILAPLLKADAVSIVPITPLIADRAILLETCPASYLKRVGLYDPYKDKKGDEKAGHLALQNRKRIINHLIDKGMFIESKEVLNSFLGDRFGDAIDSLIATMILFENLSREDRFAQSLQEEFNLEGYVYF